MKYAIVMKKNNRTGRVLAYANAVNTYLSFDELANMATQECTVTRADVEAVLRAVLDIMKRELLRGNAIRLNSMGTLFPQYHSAGTADEKEFNASLIKQVNIRFRATRELKNQLHSATFELALTKAGTKSGIKNSHDLIMDAIAASDGGDGNGGN